MLLSLQEHLICRQAMNVFLQVPGKEVAKERWSQYENEIIHRCCCRLVFNKQNTTDSYATVNGFSLRKQMILAEKTTSKHAETREKEQEEGQIAGNGKQHPTC